MIALPLNEILMLLAALVAAGLAGGVIAGLFGALRRAVDPMAIGPVMVVLVNALGRIRIQSFQAVKECRIVEFFQLAVDDGAAFHLQLAVDDIAGNPGIRLQLEEMLDFYLRAIKQ